MNLACPGGDTTSLCGSGDAVNGNQYLLGTYYVPGAPSHHGLQKETLSGVVGGFPWSPSKSLPVSREGGTGYRGLTGSEQYAAPSDRQGN